MKKIVFTCSCSPDSSREPQFFYAQHFTHRSLFRRLLNSFFIPFPTVPCFLNHASRVIVITPIRSHQVRDVVVYIL